MRAEAALATWLGDYRGNRIDLPGADDPRLAERRDRAIALAESAGLPHRRLEDWKYSDLLHRLASDYEPATPWAGALAREGAPADPFAEIASDTLVFANGFFRADVSPPPAGLTVSTLAESGVPDWALPALDAQLTRADDAVGNLNLALARDGVFITVPAGFKAERPLHIVYLDPAASGARRARTVRSQLRLEEGAELTLIETYLGKGSAEDVTNAALDIALGEGAVLSHVRVLRDGEGATQIHSLNAALGKDARYAPTILNLGAGYCRTTMRIAMQGTGAHARVTALAALGGSEHNDLTTILRHAVPGTTAMQTVKSVLAGKSRGIYQGRVVVMPGANGTDSTQLAKSVLLSREAEADTKPELEILADDVKCAHGATTGALDPAALFYLRARGIPKAEALAMLVEAFLGDALAAIADEPLREAAAAALRARLAALEVTL